jgi:PQQ enzyme repeat
LIRKWGGAAMSETAILTGGVVLGGVAMAKGVVYVGSQDKNVYAVNATTGAKLWSFAATSAVFYSPVIAHGGLYIESIDTTCALNRRPTLELSNRREYSDRGERVFVRRRWHGHAVCVWPAKVASQERRVFNIAFKVPRLRQLFRSNCQRVTDRTPWS